MSAKIEALMRVLEAASRAYYRYPIWEGRKAMKRARKALRKQIKQEKAIVWEKAVDTALNHAIRNDDKITLRLEHLDGRPWKNPYDGTEYDNAFKEDDPVAVQPSITCPRCGMTSYNLNDIREGFCGNCHGWTGTPANRQGLEPQLRTVDEILQFVPTPISKTFGRDSEPEEVEENSMPEEDPDLWRKQQVEDEMGRDNE